MSNERTLVLVKPDGVQRGLIGQIVGRFERRGLQMVGIKMIHIDSGLAQRHYAEHREKPFFAGLVEFITSSPVVAMVWSGESAVSVVRTMMGATDPAKAAPGTIRGDLALSLSLNVVHGSDSPARAEEEIALFFSSREMVTWEPAEAVWIAG